MKESMIINIEKFAAFIGGDEGGLKFYFERFYPSLLLFAKKFLKKPETCEDIVSECFFTIWNKREMFKDEQHLKSYLYKAVYNNCLKANRLRINEELGDPAEAADDFDYSSELIKSETMRLLYQAIDRLPAQCKQVFTQLYVEGNTVRETADAMGIAVSTVKAQKARGLQLLRAKLGDVDPGMLVVFLPFF